MSYNIAGALIDTSDDAAKAILGEWMWGINTAETVASYDADEIYRETLEDLPTLEAVVVGEYDEHGEAVYEDVTPSNDRRRQMIANIIQEARDFVENK